MLSTEQMGTPGSPNSDCRPRRFLKKGEGLKRFAAYKPPLPTTVKKVERRKTFVKFNLDAQTKDNVKRDPPLHFLPPEILNDDSVNLSTEVPRIAPPKIMHTPVRPKRQAFVTLTNLSTPTSGNCVLAVDRRIQLIESTINELREMIEKCECGVLKPQQPPPPAEKRKSRSRRPLTRAAAKAAKNPSDSNSDRSTASTQASNEDTNRPSADADNCNSTKKVLNNLVHEIAELKAQIGALRLSD